MAGSDTRRDDIKGGIASNRAEDTAANVPVMRSRSDELTVWQAARRNKLLGVIAMAAAFSASLDGYRESPFILK